MSIANRRDTCSPPIPNPSIWVRLRVWPRQLVLTRQIVLPFAGSRLTPSIRASRSSTLMPLTVLGSAVFVRATMIFVPFLDDGGGGERGSLQRDECRLNAPALVFGDQVGQHFSEVRVPGTRMDVLPAV